jgi:hypothetical protein
MVGRIILVASGLAVFLAGAAACGVKGPPLPPIATTPQKSDIQPRPSPSVSPAPPSLPRSANEPSQTSSPKDTH